MKKFIAISFIALAGVSLISCSAVEEKKATSKEIAEKYTDENGKLDIKKLQEIDPILFKDRVAQALEAETGQRPEITCGKDGIPVQLGTKVLCHLDDGGQIYEVEVTVGSFKTVEDFGLSLNVAKAPGVLEGSSTGVVEEFPTEIGKKDLTKGGE